MGRRTKTLVFNGGKPLLPTQQALLDSSAKIRCFFGGYGSGKTRGCALAFLLNCLENPHRPEYGNDRPISLLVAYTHKVLVDSALREFKAVCPPELIRRERKNPNWEIELANGHCIRLRTVRGALEGASACTVWVDEVQKIEDEKLFVNLQMRARDPLARKSLVLVSGIPESGWLYDYFAEKHDPDRFIIFGASRDNTYLQAHVLHQLRVSVSEAEAKRYLEGQWIAPEKTIYHEYRAQPFPKGNLWDYAGDRAQPVHVGIDVGEQAAVVFFQEVRRKFQRPRLGGGVEIYETLGLHAIDELTPDKNSLQSVARLIRDRGWVISPSQSMFCVDPTIRPDEITALRSVFPDARLVVKKRGEREEQVKYGIRCVKAALRDADGNTRLTFRSSLPREKRSLLTSILRYRYGPSGRPYKDDTVDHVMDALRYPVVALLPVMDSLRE